MLRVYLNTFEAQTALANDVTNFFGKILQVDKIESGFLIIKLDCIKMANYIELEGKG